MNRISTFIFIFLLPISVLGNHPYKINLNKEDDNLRGKVSVVIEQITDFGRAFILVKNYNDKGMLVRANYYEPKDTSYLKLDTINLFLARSELHEYETNGKLLKTKVISVKYEHMEYTKQNYYDKNDSLIAIVTSKISKDSIEKDSTNIYYSNYKDSLIEVTVNNKFDTITKRVIFRNSNGNLLKILTKESDNNCLNSKNYYYDKIGNLITFIETEFSEDKNDNCEASIIKTYIYDEYHRIIYLEYSTNINSIKREISTYEYDLKGLISNNSTYYYSEDKIKGYEKSKLDENNDYKTLIKEYFYTDNNIVNIHSEEIIYKNKYDENWNWVESRIFRNEVENNCRKRIIKYTEW